ncbi:MAG: hypothetical protein QG656_2288, partial [Candidatus Hydrogenedentes bacterium]|nr:hypothetical protein [Candidatus Hydrogenedentota bacterium]
DEHLLALYRKGLVSYHEAAAKAQSLEEFEQSVRASGGGDDIPARAAS